MNINTFRHWWKPVMRTQVSKQRYSSTTIFWYIYVLLLLVMMRSSLLLNVDLLFVITVTFCFIIASDTNRDSEGTINTTIIKTSFLILTFRSTFSWCSKIDGQKYQQHPLSILNGSCSPAHRDVIGRFCIVYCIKRQKSMKILQDFLRRLNSYKSRREIKDRPPKWDYLMSKVPNLQKCT